MKALVLLVVCLGACVDLRADRIAFDSFLHNPLWTTGGSVAGSSITPLTAFVPDPEGEPARVAPSPGGAPFDTDPWVLFTGLRNDSRRNLSTSAWVTVRSPGTGDLVVEDESSVEWIALSADSVSLEELALLALTLFTLPPDSRLSDDPEQLSLNLPLLPYLRSLDLEEQTPDRDDQERRRQRGDRIHRKRRQEPRETQVRNSVPTPEAGLTIPLVFWLFCLLFAFSRHRCSPRR